MTCTDISRGHGETVRTSSSSTRLGAAPAGKRFELRLTDAQLARWRAIAASRGVSVADLIRAAVEFADVNMPADYMARSRAAEVQDAVALFARALLDSERTDAPAAAATSDEAAGFLQENT